MPIWRKRLGGQGGPRGYMSYDRWHCFAICQSAIRFTQILYASTSLSASIKPGPRLLYIFLLCVQVEAFGQALLSQSPTWGLAELDQWQRSLRHRTYDIFFPRRMWYDVIHRTNLRSGRVVLTLCLDEFLKRERRRG